MALVTTVNKSTPVSPGNAHAPQMTGTGQSVGITNASYKAIQRITCLGSGFVGGMVLFQIPFSKLRCELIVARPYICCHRVQVRR